MTVHQLLTRGGATLAATVLALTGTVGVNAASNAASPSPSATATGVGPGGGSGAGLTTLKAKCAAAIATRQTTLTADTSLVNGSNTVTASDRASLLSKISNDQSGLAALGTKIQADTTFAQAKAVCGTIVTGYRVYLVLGPQIHLTLAADRTAATDAEFTTVSGELQAAVNNSSLSASLKQAADRTIDDLNSKIAQSQKAVAPISAEVLALTPSDYPNNVSALEAARISLSNSASALAGARADVNTVIKALGQ